MVLKQESLFEYCLVHSGINLRSKSGLFIFLFRSKMDQLNNPLRQQETSITSRKTEYDHSDSVQSKSTTHNAFTPMGQQAFNRPPSATYTQQSRALPAPVPQNNSWKFTNSFGPQRPPFEAKRSDNNPPAVRQTHAQVAKYMGHI